MTVGAPARFPCDVAPATVRESEVFAETTTRVKRRRRGERPLRRSEVTGGLTSPALLTILTPTTPEVELHLAS